MQFSPVAETVAVYSPPPSVHFKKQAHPHPPHNAEDLGLAWHHSNRGGKITSILNQASEAAASAVLVAIS